MGATTVKQALITSKIEVIEVLSNTTLSDPDVTHALNDDHTLTASSTPDAELVYSGVQALTAGTATIDLMALTNTEGTTIITNTKIVRAIKIKATAGNANPITLTEGASNGYELFGNGWTVALEAGDHILAYLGANAPAVSASTKDIDL